jgi:hypothetical protein
MTISSKYYYIDEDILLEFRYHDQSQRKLYNIDVDDNGSELMILNTDKNDNTQRRHLIHQLGSKVVNFDVTLDNGVLAVERFAQRTLLLEVGKTYKFNLSNLPDPNGFIIHDQLGSINGPDSSGYLEFIPATTGSTSYSYSDNMGNNYKGGKIEITRKSNPFYTKPNEETGNGIDQTVGQYQGIQLANDNSTYAILGFDSKPPYNKWNFIENSEEWNGFDTQELMNIKSQATSQIDFVRYDTIRLHLKNGTSFAARGYDGFIFEVLANRLNGIKNNLTQLVYLNHSTFEYANPKPFILNERLYTKFIEVKVPTLVNNNYNFNSFFYDDGQGESDLDPESNYEISFKFIDKLETVNNIDYAVTGEEKVFTIPREDENKNYSVGLEHANDGDYFTIVGEKNGSPADFDADIMNRIQTSADDINVIFDVQVFEQKGASFIQTFDTTFTKIQDFNEPIKFRPIIQNSDAVSFAIDVTMRIFNATDNTQIIKQASLTSREVGKYGKNLMKVGIDSSNQITEVYNVLPSSSNNRKIKDSLVDATPKKEISVPTFIERYNVAATAVPVSVNVNDEAQIDEIQDLDTSDFVLDNKLEILIPPTDAYYKFKIARKRGNDLELLDLSNIDNLYLKFSSDNSTFSFVNIPNSQINPVKGEVLFKISKDNAIKLGYLNRNPKFYITARSKNEETLIIRGNTKNWNQ